MKIIIILLTTFLFTEREAKLFDGRIVGGQDADISDFPYQVSLQMVNHHMCGGAIIGKKWIITAAHCYHKGYNPLKIISARTGSSNRSSGGNVYKIEEILIHPEFNKSTMVYDIALIRTTTDMVDNNIEPITLPEPDMVIEVGKQAIVSGWGKLQYKDKSFPETLQYIKINIVDQEKCKNSLAQFVKVGKTMFCAANDGKDACKGDSGGPIVLNKKLIGVVSFGIGCADPELPGVYTRLANPEIRKWIKDLTQI